MHDNSYPTCHKSELRLFIAFMKGMIVMAIMCYGAVVGISSMSCAFMIGMQVQEQRMTYEIEEAYFDARQSWDAGYRSGIEETEWVTCESVGSIPTTEQYDPWQDLY